MQVMLIKKKKYLEIEHNKEKTHQKSDNNANKNNI